MPALSGQEILDQVLRLGEIADFEVIDFARLPGPHWTLRFRYRRRRSIIRGFSTGFGSTPLS
jgi:hypothetical protein